MDYETLILHNENEIDRKTGALSIPIYNTSTFHQKDFEQSQQYEYTRSGNPSRSAVEGTLAVLERVKYGYAFASGMAAISGALMGLFSTGDHIIVTKDIYGGAWRLFSRVLNRFGITSTFADCTDIDSLESLVTPATKGLYIETPTNPLLKIIDVVKAADFAKRHNLISLIDNTFMTPYLMRPVALGIDVSIHSATKFLSGHSDLLCGAVMTDDYELAKKIYFIQNALGTVLGPNDSWLLQRGIKTLGVRMKQESATALAIATWLASQPWVSGLYYPGLASHPGHEILASQADGFGAVLSFRTDSAERAKRLLTSVKIWAVAVSLGGVDSIMSYPVAMSHASIPKEEREILGITDTLIRLSAGLESADDLIADLDCAKG